MKIFFVQFFCVFLPSLLNILCFCYVYTISVIYCTHLCMKCSLVSLIFLKRSPVFPILLFPSISLHWSLRKDFLSLLTILWNSAFKWVYLSFSPLPFALLRFFSQIFVRPHQTNIFFFFCIYFSWEWSWSLPLVQCYILPSIVFRHSVYQIILESICHFHCIIVRDLI